MTGVLVALSVAAAAAAEGPSFDCDGEHDRSMVDLICADAALAALDRRLADVYARALASAAATQPPALKAEQRGWIAVRDDCWKSAEQRACVETSYRLRIAELEARFALVPEVAAVTLLCDGDPRRRVTVRYFATVPATALMADGGAPALLYQAPTASGIHYIGASASLREHQGKVTIRRDDETPDMHCQAPTR